MTPRLQNCDFRCNHCGNFVSALSLLCGVNNRNHCPNCLWSRHLDLAAAGDRLSACKAPMQPLGLTMKPGHNKYARAGGELMLIHACLDCGRISMNRIAADDDVDSLFAVFVSSFGLSSHSGQELLNNGIRLLGSQDLPMVRRQLLGK